MNTTSNDNNERDHNRPGHGPRPGSGQRPGFGPRPGFDPRGFGARGGFQGFGPGGARGGFGMWLSNPPYGAGPGFGPGPRRTPRGGVRMGILGLLADQALNGYALMQAFAEKSGGKLQPKSGAVYPALGQLLEAGLIEVDTEGNYSLTDRGHKMVDHQREFIANLFGFGNDDPVEEPVAHAAYRKLTEAFAQLVNTGTEEQQARIAEKLDQLRRDIYKELSE